MDSCEKIDTSRKKIRKRDRKREDWEIWSKNGEKR